MLQTRKIVLLAATSALALAARPAFAHVTIDNAETTGGSFKAVFNVPHGCDGSATTAITITIPEGVIGVKPVPKPGWTLATTKAPYAKTYDHVHGRKVSEGVKTVTWSGGKLPNEHLDEFKLGLFVTKDLAPGSTIYFPVKQTCEAGSHDWAEVPTAGQNPHDLASPAPALKIIAAKTQGAAVQAPTVITAGNIKIETPWLRATPGGATVGAGYVKITNSGTEADRLTGGDFAIAGRVEIHEIADDGGVKKMRALAGGVDLRPGVAVTFAPGGLHLMLLDLTAPLVSGAVIRGTLAFEKAGKVPVDFAVAPVGSAAAPEPHSHHH